MEKITLKPLTYTAPDGSELTVIHAYSRLDKALKVETVILQKGRTIATFISFTGTYRAVSKAACDIDGAGIFDLTLKVEEGYRYFGKRIGFKKNERIAVVSSVTAEKSEVYSDAFRYAFNHIFDFLSEAGFDFNRPVYSNRLLETGDFYDIDVEEYHDRLVSGLDCMVVSLAS